MYRFEEIRDSFVAEDINSYPEAYDYELAAAVAGKEKASTLLWEMENGLDLCIPDGDKAIFMAGLELGKRYARPAKACIASPRDIYKAARRFWNPDQEVMIVIALNGAHNILYSGVVSMGLVNRTIVHAREVFSEPLKQRATAIAIAHNHPSGNVDPSDDDIEVTKRLVNAGEILGVKVLDHLVFTDELYFSFLEHGLM